MTIDSCGAKSVKDLPDKEKVWVLLYASDGK